MEKDFEIMYTNCRNSKIWKLVLAYGVISMHSGNGSEFSQSHT